MGFYSVVLRKDLDVAPQNFGKSLPGFLKEQLIRQVEGTTNGKYGLIVAVIKVDNISPGIIRKDGTGFATFSMEYSAVVCRPYQGEVVDAVVTTVNQVGFFAEAGPINFFVSNHLIPSDWEFNAVGDPCYQAPDGSLSIREGSDVRVKVVGVKIDQSEIFCIGTIKDDYLGLIK